MVCSTAMFRANCVESRCHAAETAQVAVQARPKQDRHLLRDSGKTCRAAAVDELRAAHPHASFLENPPGDAIEYCSGPSNILLQTKVQCTRYKCVARVVATGHEPLQRESGGDMPEVPCLRQEA